MSHIETASQVSHRDEEAQLPRPSRGSTFSDCFIGWCRFLNGLTGLSATLCMVAFGMSLAKGGAFTEHGAKIQIIRLYGLVMSAVMALFETEWHVFTRYALILENWVARGFTLSFLGVLTLEAATSSGSSDFDISLRLYRTIAGTFLLVCAGMYIVGGVLCFEFLKRAKYRRMKERLQMQRDMDELERQRDELQNQLLRQDKD